MAGELSRFQLNRRVRLKNRWQITDDERIEISYSSLLLKAFALPSIANIVHSLISRRCSDVLMFCSSQTDLSPPTGICTPKSRP